MRASRLSKRLRRHSPVTSLKLAEEHLKIFMNCIYSAQLDYSQMIKDCKSYAKNLDFRKMITLTSLGHDKDIRRDIWPSCNLGRQHKVRPLVRCFLKVEKVRRSHLENFWKWPLCPRPFQPPRFLFKRIIDELKILGPHALFRPLLSTLSYRL